MLNLFDERLRMAVCEDSLIGLSTMVEVFKNGYIEGDFWDKSPIQAHEDTRRILQTVVTTLNGIAEEIGNICESIDKKEEGQEVAA